MMMLTEQDHEDMEKAAQLLNQVMDRHNKDITMGIMSMLCQTVHDIRIAEKIMERS